MCVLGNEEASPPSRGTPGVREGWSTRSRFQGAQEGGGRWVPRNDGEKTARPTDSFFTLPRAWAFSPRRSFSESSLALIRMLCAEGKGSRTQA